MNNLIQLTTRLYAKLRTEIRARIGGEISLTEREKTILGISSALLVLAIWLTLNAWVGRMERAYTHAQIEYGRLKSQVESGSWSERRNEGAALRSVLENRLWTADTPGLAEAGLERWIRNSLTRSGAEPRQVQVKRSPLIQKGQANVANNPLADIQRMTAKVYMPLTEPALLTLIADVAEANKMLVVDRLIVRAGRNSRAEMDVSTFFRHHEPTP